MDRTPFSKDLIADTLMCYGIYTVHKLRFEKHDQYFKGLFRDLRAEIYNDPNLKTLHQVMETKAAKMNDRTAHFRDIYAFIGCQQYGIDLAKEQQKDLKGEKLAEMKEYEYTCAIQIAQTQVVVDEMADKLGKDKYEEKLTRFLKRNVDVLNNLERRFLTQLKEHYKNNGQDIVILSPYVGIIE